MFTKARPCPYGNPYTGLPNHSYWRRSVAGFDQFGVDPVSPPPFAIAPSDRVATAGSCFAQHIARHLVSQGFCYLVTEQGPQTPHATPENYGVFPCRFGNVYTVRQLLQLFQRAFALFEPQERVWRRPDGRFVDPFRPQIQAAGFLTEAAVEQDRHEHLAATQLMFENCEVFIFTLGLTEGWISISDGAVFPLAPGVIAESEQTDTIQFCNFEVEECTADLLTFIDALRDVNPGVRIILTVSPVPLIATFENQHVLAATNYSKSVLRVVAETVSRRRSAVAYFPSYEIITGLHARSAFFGKDLREITPEGVGRVMELFGTHYLSGLSTAKSSVAAADIAGLPLEAAPLPSVANEDQVQQLLRDADGVAAVICDEEVLEAAGQSRAGD